MPNPNAEAQLFFARLPLGFVIELAGADAARVINNLCTNDILKQLDGTSLETFVTDVRGWVVAHAVVRKEDGKILIAGSHPEPSSICKHIDRYIIREDVQVGDRSSQQSLLLIGGTQASVVLKSLQNTPPLLVLTVWSHPALGKQASAVSCAREHLAPLIELLTAAGGHNLSEAEFEWTRIANFWPMTPADFGEKTIPQELDRDSSTISFTKGCYLGQETIARLDARGQIQRKLCLVELITDQHSAVIQAGAALIKDGKQVGNLTSIGFQPDAPRKLCLAMLRRGNFEPGNELICHTALVRVLSPLSNA